MAHYARNHAIYAKARGRAVTVVVRAHKAEYQALYQQRVVEVRGPSARGNRRLTEAEVKWRRAQEASAQRWAREQVRVKYLSEWEAANRVEVERLRGTGTGRAGGSGSQSGS